MNRSIVAACLCLAAACHRNLDKPGTTTTTGAVVRASDASYRLTRARCDRELLCNDIGEGREFKDWDVCEQQNLERTRYDIEASGCRKGLGGRELEVCLSAIRDAKCSEGLESIERLDGCRRGRLCAAE
jgi:hypothetical protein